MVKNVRGGNKAKKCKSFKEETTLHYKTEDQVYGQVTKLLGSCRTEVFCYDGIIRQCTIRGKMRKRVYINKDDIVIVSLRDFQDKKGDIVDKYSEEQKRTLIDQNEIPDLDLNNPNSIRQFTKIKELNTNTDDKNDNTEEYGYYWAKSSDSDKNNNSSNNVSYLEEEEEEENIDIDDI